MAHRLETAHEARPIDTVLRLAFVGRHAQFAACALDEDSARIRTAFVDYRDERDAEPMLGRLEAFAPHVVVVFGPEELPSGALATLRAAVVGFVIEPVSAAASETAGIDPANVDRLVSFDPLLVPADGEMEVWRALPMPVADRLFRAVTRVHGAPRMLFVGDSTARRERFLADVKQRFDCLHVAFEIPVEELEPLLDSHQVTFNIHSGASPGFESRVLLHLAAGQLVISEPLSPTHGLEPGFDFVEVRHPEDLLEFATEAHAFPDAFHRIRVRGRLKAESVRASRVWPALARDLFDDLRAFGTHREAALRAVAGR
jgi:hypothetical protein